MSIRESYSKYMSNEIPEYDPKWIIDDHPFDQFKSEKNDDYKGKMSIYLFPG